MHVALGTPKPGRQAPVPHHLVSTPEIRAQAYPAKDAERGVDGRPWVLWRAGTAT